MARECDDTATAMWSANPPAELAYKKPRSACIHREVPIKALDRRTDDVALYRFGVRDHERGDRPHRSLHRVENIGRRVREAEIGLDRRGLGAERFKLVAQPGDISRIAAP